MSGAHSKNAGLPEVADIYFQLDVANTAACQLAGEVSSKDIAQNQYTKQVVLSTNSQVLQVQQMQQELQAQKITGQQDIDKLQAENSLLREKLAAAKADSWQASVTMSDLAASNIVLEKEKRDLERIREELKKQQEELESARLYFLGQQKDLEKQKVMPHLSVEDMAQLRAQYMELDHLIPELESVLSRRAMFIYGAALEAAGPDSKLRAAAAEEVDPALSYLRSLRRHMQIAQQYLMNSGAVAVHASGCHHAAGGAYVQNLNPVLVAQHLREQHVQLMRLAHHLASDAEADAAKLMQRQTKISELQHEVSRCKADIQKFSAEASQVR